MKNENNIVILIADDDDDDCMLLKIAFKKGKLINNLQVVNDGEQLMSYLLGEGKYSNRETYPIPDLILLDLNMPRKSGREALEEIKNHQTLKLIPVVILTTSKAQEDIIKSYGLGVNSFITKPVTFDKLVEVTIGLEKYWFSIVKLPMVK